MSDNINDPVLFQITLSDVLDTLEMYVEMDANDYYLDVAAEVIQRLFSQGVKLEILPDIKADIRAATGMDDGPEFSTALIASAWNLFNTEYAKAMEQTPNYMSAEEKRGRAAAYLRRYVDPDAALAIAEGVPLDTIDRVIAASDREMKEAQERGKAWLEAHPIEEVQ